MGLASPSQEKSAELQKLQLPHGRRDRNRLPVRPTL
jgi:hypothetical protein